MNKIILRPFNGPKNDGVGVVDGLIAMGVIGIGLTANLNIYSSTSKSTRMTIANLSFAQIKSSIAETLHSKSILVYSAKSSLLKCIKSSGVNDCINNSNVSQDILEIGTKDVLIGLKPTYFKNNGELTKDVKKGVFKLTLTEMKALCYLGEKSCDIASEISIKYRLTPVISNYKLLGAPSASYFEKSPGTLDENYTENGKAIIRVAAFKISEKLTTTDCNPGSYKLVLKNGHKVFNADYKSAFTPKLLEGFDNISRDGTTADAVCNNDLAGPSRGNKGIDGVDGSAGAAGIAGPRGFKGPNGPQGFRGARPGVYGGAFNKDTRQPIVSIPRDNSI